MDQKWSTFGVCGPCGPNWSTCPQFLADSALWWELLAMPHPFTGGRRNYYFRNLHTIFGHWTDFYRNRTILKIFEKNDCLTKISVREILKVVKIEKGLDTYPNHPKIEF